MNKGGMGMSITAFKFSRAGLIQTLSAVDPESVDIIPEGFNNSIRWNAGHILSAADNMLALISDYQRLLPTTYSDFFKIGTSPRDWSTEPPEWSEMLDYIKRQTEQVENLFNRNEKPTLLNPLEIRGISFATVEEVLAFINGHEGLHHGTIKAYLRLIK